MRAIPPPVLLGLLFAPALPAQGFDLDGSLTGDRFGTALARLDDLDSDGFDDIAIGIPGDDRAGNNSGAVEVVSAADGSTLYVILGPHPGDQFGNRIIAAGDVDGDGVIDLAVASLRDDNFLFVSGAVYLHSGATGALIRSYHSSSDWDRFGHSMASLGDIDGDSVHDLAVGAPDDSFSGIASGAVRVFSGADGTVVHTLRGEEAWDRFGYALARLGDQDGDGVAELVISSPFADIGAQQAGEVRIYSGRTGASMRRTKGRERDAFYGTAVVGFGDIDGDGLADYAASGVNDATGILGLDAYVDVRSGATGKLLYRLEQENDGDRFGFSLATHDLNGDGISDLVVGSPMAGKVGGTGISAGMVTAYSGPSGRLLLKAFGPGTGAQFGTSIAGTNDLVGNGYSGLAVGAPAASNVGKAVTRAALDYPLLSTGVLISNQSALLEVSNGNSGASYQFSASTTALGRTLETGGALLDLAGPLVALGSATADASGQATLSKTVPPGTTGLVVYLQAWRPSNSPTAVTNVVVRTIQ